ncbi:MAG: UrcA family protein [Limisphaerales bacterium]|jgi:UrcA family protein
MAGALIMKLLQMNTVKLSGTALVAVVGIFFGMSAVAANHDYTVSYSYTDLTTSQGVENVHKNIVKAAKQYCPTYSQIRSHADVKNCVTGVIEDLVSKVNHPQLTSLHETGSAVSVAATSIRTSDPS